MRNETDPKPIYLDFQATTPTDPRVVEAMMPYWYEVFGNPHSQSHRYGHEAHEAVERARQQVADLIGADSDEIIFTSGATESNNIVINGVPNLEASRSSVAHSAIEHKCVMESCNALQENGYPVYEIPVNAHGVVDTAKLQALQDDQIALVSVMYANNEIGTVQPVREISEWAHEHGALFHVDAAQAAGKIPIDVIRDGIDLMSLSAHKIYGPNGIGALYIRREIRHAVKPLMHGGFQEKGYRPGTLPLPLCIGFGKACELARNEMERDRENVETCRKTFLDTLSQKLSGFQLNVDTDERIPGTLNLRLPVSDVDLVLNKLRDQIAVSRGSACASGFIEPSHVLAAIGLSRDKADQSIRISFGRPSDIKEAETAAKHLEAAISMVEM